MDAYRHLFLHIFVSKHLQFVFRLNIKAEQWPPKPANRADFTVLSKRLQFIPSASIESVFVTGDL